MSYLKFISASQEGIPTSWAVNPDKAYLSLSDTDRAGFIFQQCLILRYLYLAYGGGIPVLIRNYASVTWERVRGLIQRSNVLLNDPNTKQQELEKGSFSSYVNLIRELASGFVIERTEEAKEALLSTIRCGHDYPNVLSDTPTQVSFYDTFLTYLSHVSSDFSTNQLISFPSISLVGQRLVICYDAVFNNYTRNQKLRDNLIASQIVPNTFFDFISGYSWNDKPDHGLMTLVGILSTYSLDLDDSWLYKDYDESTNNRILDNPRTKIGLLEISRSTSNESKIYNMLHKLMCRFDPYVKTPFDALETSSEANFRRLFISLLIALRRQYNLVFTESSTGMLSTVMGEGEIISSYLNAANTKGVSNEAISEFRQSVFAEFPELRLGNRIADPKVSSDHRSVPSASLEESLKALRIHDVVITGPAPFKDAKNDDVEESDSKSATSKTPDLTLDDMPTDDSTEQGGDNLPDISDLGEDERGDVGATGDDDTPGTKSDNGKDESTDGETEDDTEKSDTEGEEKSDKQRDKISMRPVPPPADVSDKEGVKLELTSSETTDTVFYRMELKTWIDSILDNPPKTISQQKIQVLRKIEAFWLNILTPQCLHDLIDSVVKLPAMFNIHKGKKS